MVHVYMKSSTPLKPWSVMRSAGANTLRVGGGRYLVLWNAQVVRKEGQWHYVFDFEGQDTLDKGEMARLMAGANGAKQYKGDTDWKKFLGKGYKVISAKRRNQIVMQGSRVTGQGDVKISCTQLAHSPFTPALSA